MLKKTYDLDQLYDKVVQSSKISGFYLFGTYASMGTTFFSFLNPIFPEMTLPMILSFSGFLSKFFKYYYKIDEKCVNSLEYLKLENNYYFLLNELKELLVDIEIENPMEIFAAYYYLVRNGFLSMDKTFYADRNDKKFHTPSSIIEGTGVCRHLSPFLTDLLNIFEYDAYNIGMYLRDEDKLCVFNDDFYYRFSSSNKTSEDILSKKDSHFYKLMSNLFFNLYGNHITTLLYDKNESYILDPMNNTFYLIKSHGASSFGKENLCPLKYKKINDSKNISLLEKMRIYNASSSKINNIDYLVDEYYGVRDRLDDYLETFERFYLEHKELYQEIVNDRNEFEKKYVKIKNVRGHK